MPENKTTSTDSATPDDAVTPVLPPVSDSSDEPSSSDTPAPSEPKTTDKKAPEPASEPADSTIVEPVLPDDAKAKKIEEDSRALYPEIAAKISEAHNVLIALSSNPSVDEMAAAIGLTLYLDKLGKRTTAIYSGSTPNALEFLKPEETFESTADALQDFVIALNKEKADHIRYKIDGDFVKIFITPFRASITQEDLEFSYGDFNVDLVLALDVANGIDLDSALREHGRIMHDAVIINITTGNPGKFGEIEWSDKHASSVSEMISRLLYSVNSKIEIGKEEATAFLTGIVAATNRFSNASTTPETMQTASKLMRSGANQQLVSKNITPDIDNELFSLTIDKMKESSKKKNDPTKLDIEHEGEEGVDETLEVQGDVTEKASTLLDELKAAEASLAGAGAEAFQEEENNTLKIDNEEGTESVEGPAAEKPTLDDKPEPLLEAPEFEPDMTYNPETESEPTPEPTPASTPEPASVPEPELASTPEPTSAVTPEPVPEPLPEPPSEFASEPAPEPSEPSESSEPPMASIAQPEKVLQPSADLESGFLSAPEDNKYGHMLEEAIEGLEPTEPTVPTFSPAENPAAMYAPSVPGNPEINGVPEMNYMPMPGDEILPPPPAPSVEFGLPVNPVENVDLPPLPQVQPIAPAGPVAEPTPEPLGANPSMQDQVYAPQASDPGAFKIPGM